MKNYPKNQIYNKLVRDKIPEIIKASGQAAVTETLSKEDMIHHLKDKLVEESAELVEATTKDEIALEMSDIYEVLQAIAVECDISLEEVERMRLDRLTKRGGFTKRIYLIETKEREND